METLRPDAHSTPKEWPTNGIYLIQSLIERAARTGASPSERELVELFPEEESTAGPSPAWVLNQCIRSREIEHDTVLRAAAMQVVVAARGYSERYLNAVDRSYLWASHARLLCLEQNASRRTLAAWLYQDAAEMVRQSGRLQWWWRFLFWCAGRTAHWNRQEGLAVEAFVQALKGDTGPLIWGPYHLVVEDYLSLPGRARKQLREAVWDALLQAIVWLPAHTALGQIDSSREAAGTMGNSSGIALMRWGELSSPEEVTVLGRALVKAGLAEGLRAPPVARNDSGGKRHSHRERRLGALLMLLDEEDEILLDRERWLREARQLWAKQEEHRRARAHATRVEDLLENAAHRGGGRVLVPSEPSVLPDPISLLPREAQSFGRKISVWLDLEGKPIAEPLSDSGRWAKRCWDLADQIARGRSVAAAIKLIDKALQHVKAPSTPEAYEAMARLFRARASLLSRSWRMGRAVRFLHEAVVAASHGGDATLRDEAIDQLIRIYRSLGQYGLARHLGDQRPARERSGSGIEPDGDTSLLVETESAGSPSAGGKNAKDQLERWLGEERPPFDSRSVPGWMSLVIQQEPPSIALRLVNEVLRRLENTGDYQTADQVTRIIIEGSSNPAARHKAWEVLIHQYVRAVDSCPFRAARRVLGQRLGRTVVEALLDSDGYLPNDDPQKLYSLFTTSKSELSLDLEEAASREDDDAMEEANFEQAGKEGRLSPPRLRDIQDELEQQKACLLDILVGKNGLVVLGINSYQVQSFRQSFEAYGGIPLRQRFADLERLSRNYKEVKEYQHPLQSIRERIYRDKEVPLSNRRRERLHQVWQALGELILTPEVREFIRDCQLIYLSPCPGIIQRLPLHLLPIDSAGTPLIQEKQVLYLPSTARATWRHEKSDFEEERYLLFNTTLESGSSPGKPLPSVSLFATGDANQWEQVGDADLSVEARLDAIGRSRCAVLFTHGVFDQQIPTRSKLLLPRGGGLEVADVLSCRPQQFEGVEALIFACNSARAKREHPDLGFATAFLRRGADAVLGCLWEVLVADAMTFARTYLKERERAGRAAAYQRAVLSMRLSNDGTLEGMLRAGAFVLFGADDGKPLRA